MQADAPNTALIPESDAVGVTVVLITCTYRGQEFIRIGYYVNNEYTGPELRENPPIKPDYAQVIPIVVSDLLFYVNYEAFVYLNTTASCLSFIYLKICPFTYFSIDQCQMLSPH